jgi:hypothetical protein
LVLKIDHALMRTLWLNAFAIVAVMVAVTLVVIRNIEGDG